jgi:hypothetical protein
LFLFFCFSVFVSCLVIGVAIPSGFFLSQGLSLVREASLDVVFVHTFTVLGVSVLASGIMCHSLLRMSWGGGICRHGALATALVGLVSDGYGGQWRRCVLLKFAGEFR